MEVLRHWRIAKQCPLLFADHPARVYHRDSGDNLTGADSAIKRSGDMVKAIKVLISEHGEEWLKNCPDQLGKYNFYICMYQTLSNKRFCNLKKLFEAFKYSDYTIKKKTIILGIVQFLPRAIRRRLFLFKAGL